MTEIYLTDQVVTQTPVLMDYVSYFANILWMVIGGLVLPYSVSRSTKGVI